MNLVSFLAQELWGYKMTKFLTVGKLLDQYKLQFKRSFTCTNSIADSYETRAWSGVSMPQQLFMTTSTWYAREHLGEEMTLCVVGEYEYDGQSYPRVRIEFRPPAENLRQHLASKPEDEYVFIDGGALMRFASNEHFVRAFLENIYAILAKIIDDKSIEKAEEFLRTCAIENATLTPDVIDDLYNIPNVDISLTMMKKGYAFANINKFDKLLKSFQNELLGYYTDISYQTAIVFLEDYSKHLIVDDYNQYSEFLQQMDYILQRATFRSWRYSDDICDRLRRSFHIAIHNIQQRSIELANNLEVTLPIDEVLEKNFEGENVSIQLKLEDVSW